MQHRYIVFTCIVMLAALQCLCGCRAVNRMITEKAYEGFGDKPGRFGWTGGRTYTLNDEALAETPMEGTVTFENVQVSYQNGLGEQARRIAEHAAYITRSAADAIALEFTHSLHAYLLRVDDIPENMDINLKVDPNTMPLPLFVEAGREDWRTILAGSTIFPYAIVHEMTEASLIMPRQGKPVAPDMAFQLSLPIQLTVKNHTRWFREGLSNYAGYLAFKASASQVDYTVKPSMNERPFSALAGVGKDLFAWHQYSDTSKNEDYYSAALGLFLLIEDRYGSKAIRNMVAGKDALEFADGAAMIELANATLGTNIRKLAEDFEFPRTGLELKQVTPAVVLNKALSLDRGLLVAKVDPDSMAGVAGIEKNDVITHVAAEPMTYELDFEMALFTHLADETVPVIIRRKQESVTCELKLARRK